MADHDNDVEDSGLSDRWTTNAIKIALVPLLGWDAASVFQLAMTVGIEWFIAWIPAMSTSGLMLAATRISQRATDPDVRRHAGWLAWTCLVMGVFIAGIQHVLPAHLEHVEWYWRALIGSLPVAAGGWLYHIYATAQARAKAAAAAAKRAREAQRAEMLRQVEVQAAQDAIQRQRRDDEIAHARRLADVAKDRAAAETTAANATARKLADQQRLDELMSNFSKPRPVPPPAPAPAPSKPAAKPATAPRGELQGKAVAELVRRHRAGQDIATTVAAELDRAIGASTGYSKKKLADWIDLVLAQERRAS